jgi:methionyl-tRNA synthetase
MSRIEPAKVEAMVAASKEDLLARPGPCRQRRTDQGPAVGRNRVRHLRRRRPARGADRQGRAVEGADKLLRLTLDIGDEQRNVFSGIKSPTRTRPSWKAA